MGDDLVELPFAAADGKERLKFLARAKRTIGRPFMTMLSPEKRRRVRCIMFFAS